MAYVGQGIKNGTFSVLDTSGNTYNGSNVTFNLGTQVGSPAQLLVSHDGVIQKPVTDYTIATGGTQITFTTAPASGASIFITEISGAVGAPMNRDINGDELILDADGDTSITADTDDQIDIKIGGTDEVTLSSSGIVINEGSNDRDFRIESNGNTHAIFVNGGEDTVGIGNSNAHSFDDNADNLVVGTGSGHNGITIYSDGSSSGSLFFANGTSGAQTKQGQVLYEQNNSAMVFNTASTTETLRMAGGEISTGGETGPDVDAGGLCIDNNANDGFSLTFKNSDVAHSMTGEAEADTWMRMSKYSSTDGGGAIVGYSESGLALYLQGAANASNTAKSTSAFGNVVLKGSVQSGNAAGNAESNGNLVTIANHTNTRFIFDAEGSFHADVESTTYDNYDDAQLVRAFDLSHKKGVIESKFDKFIAYNHENLADMKLVGREEDGTPNHFINVTKFQQLHNGAIWQQYEKHNQLLEAVYDLAKEAVGEEKANAILDKHEVKRLQ
jgi:hypothetical protein